MPGCTRGGAVTSGGQPLDCDLEQLLEQLSGKADPGPLERLCGSEGEGEGGGGGGRWGCVHVSSRGRARPCGQR
jgi:hypothetical protein